MALKDSSEQDYFEYVLPIIMYRYNDSTQLHKVYNY